MEGRLSRRRVIGYGLGGLALLGPATGSGARRSMAQSKLETVLYASNAGGPEIYVMGMNRATGDLDVIEKVKVPADKPSPTSMPLALSPDHRFLYAAMRSEPFTVASFGIDKATGKLSHIANAPLTASIAYATTDRTGKWLLCASYPNAVLTVNAIGSDGRIESPPKQTVQNQPKAHSIILDGANKYAYSAILGADHIMQMKFDAMHGTLTPNEPPTISTKAGAGPRHLRLHPSGKFLYVITETTATIGAYAVDKDKGTLTELQFVETLPAEFKGEVSAADLQVTPDGKFLYGSERETSTLTGFRIDPDKGTLSPVGRFDTEKTPRGFAIDPRGKFLYAVGLDSNAMTAYTIDPQSGALKPLKQYPMGAMPNWIEFMDL
jgi:6-phosphogluconolactonase